MHRVLFGCLLLISFPSIAEVVDSFEKMSITKDGRYVFFLHGAIAEGVNGNPQNKIFGVYDFSGLKAALDSTEHILIAERREKGPTLDEEAGRLADKMARLLAAGVSGDRITIVGFSRGGGIAGAAMSLIGRTEVRYVLLATCPKDLKELDWGPMAGRVLSIYEGNDAWAGSCRPIAENSSSVSGFDEIRIDSGLGHGEFYRARNEWVQPLLAWLAKDS